MSITSASQAHCVIVTRSGKPVGVQESGLQLFTPSVDQPSDVREMWEERYANGANDCLEMCFLPE